MDQITKAQILETVNGASQSFLDNDPMGLPDWTDVKNINTIIRNYDKVERGHIALCVAEAKQARETAADDFNSSADKSKRRVLIMPSGLMRMIEESYPLMFRNRKHLGWFVKHYPKFSTAKRY